MSKEWISPCIWCASPSFALSLCEGFMHKLQYWKCKGPCLAAASLSGNHDVAPSKYKRHALGLHRCWQPVYQLHC